MEVHAHTHTARKKWTHYFWEFLMLFLAVFCGFFAEYKLEHKIEKERAKEYAFQLHSDLTSDSSDFNSEIRRLENSVVKLDTLSQLLNDFHHSDSATRAIYLLSVYNLYDQVFEPIITTMDQLKNSGNLRYLGDNDLRKVFSEYDVWVQIIKTHYNNGIAIENETRRMLTQILNIRDISRLNNSNAYRLISTSADVELITTDVSLLKQYSNWCIIKQKNLFSRLSVLKRAQRELRTLIQMLKNNYHFK
jgi:hypothetical protein